VRLTVLGSSGTFPTPGRPAAGYLIEHKGTNVWCDAGPGTFTALPIDPDAVDAVVVSHQHPDHCLDVLVAYHAFRYRPEPRSGVPLYAPQQVIDRLCEFVNAGDDPEIYDTFTFHPVGDDDQIELDEITVAFAITDHSVVTVGSRWEAEGRVLAYSADTGPAGEWPRLARGAHLLLSEATYQGPSGVNDYPFHMTAGEAGEIARREGARSLMLTHIPPYLDPARSVAEAEATFGRAVELAVPGLVRDI
jgi:ribonuclease BN (tRNA processing enzyme)